MREKIEIITMALFIILSFVLYLLYQRANRQLKKISEDLVEKKIDNSIKFDGNPVFDAISDFCYKNSIELICEEIDHKLVFSMIDRNGNEYPKVFTLEETKNIPKKEQAEFIAKIEGVINA